MAHGAMKEIKNLLASTCGCYLDGFYFYQYLYCPEDKYEQGFGIKKLFACFNYSWFLTRPYLATKIEILDYQS